jgi:hypothetical protein
MKKILFVILWIYLIWSSGDLFASGSLPFRGLYPILSQTNSHIEKTDYFLLDMDLMKNIWDKYGDGGALPDDLAPYKDELSVLAGFTNSHFLILTLDSLAMVGDHYLRIQGGGGKLLELVQGSPSSQLGTKDGSTVTKYVVGPPEQVPMRSEKKWTIRFLPPAI